MAVAGQLTIEMSANSAAIARDMGRARAAVTSNSARMNVSLARLRRGFKRATAALFSMRTAAVAAAGAAGLFFLARKAITTADSIAKTADKVGVGVEALQELRFAASRAGVDLKTLDLAIQRFSRRVGEAAQGSGELKDTLKQYNIAVKNADGTTRDVIDVLLDLADATAGAESAQEKLRISFKAFDSEGAALVNVTNLGSAGMKRLFEASRRLGGILSEEVIRKAVLAKDALTDMELVLSVGLTRSMLSLMPLMKGLATTFADRQFQVGLETFARLLADIGGFLQQHGKELVAMAAAFLAIKVASAALAVVPLPGWIKLVGALLAGGGAALLTYNELTERLAAVSARAAAGQEQLAGSVAKGTRIGIGATNQVDLFIDALKREAAALRLRVRLHGQSAARITAALKAQALMNLATDKSITVTEAQNKALVKVLAAYIRLQEQLDANVKKQKELDAAAANSQRVMLDLSHVVGTAFEDAVLGAKSFTDVLRALGQDIVRITLRLLVIKQLEASIAGAFGSGGIFSGIGSIFGFAHGGSPPVGRPSLVGEEGPELFVPRSAGTIIPNSGLAAGASTTFNQYITVETGVSQTVRAEMVRLLPALKAETLAGVQDARRRDPRFFGSAIG
ncbi:MAG: hypothetical protein IH904_00120 [Proteobacteria bacterium]|nr:hypothetical protein [Pseudomonadota bacterium]